RLDPHNEQLWRENQLVLMPPKTFAILRFLVEHAGQLVTKEELLKGVWPDTKVSEGILKGYIHDLRDVLEDDAQEPRFIKTVLRRGYRFIGHVDTSQQSVISSNEEARDGRLETSPASSQPASSLSPLVSNFVGRDAELTHLHRLLDKALNGERQI